MGVYAITGGSSGIGAKVVQILEAEGNEVVNVDLRGGQIDANLGTPEGRSHAIDELHRMCPDGLDGLYCNAGVAAACGDAALIIAVNYFGAIELAKGCFDLLVKKHGSIVMTSSNTISHGGVRMDLVDLMTNNSDSEEEILAIARTIDAKNLTIGHSVYIASKYALARYVRRCAATAAAKGVRINAVAPGNVRTAMTANMSYTATQALNALPIPTKYGQDALMEPEEIAEVMVFLSSHRARGINGNIIFVDGGTDALLNNDKVY